MDNVFTNVMTQSDYDKLIAERDELYRENEINKEKLQEAKAQGDLSENAEYSAAKENEGNLAAKIQEINNRISSAKIIDVSSLTTDKVQVGLYVKLYDSLRNGADTSSGTVYEIVSSQQADMLNGKLADDTEIGKKITGRAKGDVITYDFNGKERTLIILDIMASD